MRATRSTCEDCWEYFEDVRQRDDFHGDLLCDSCAEAREVALESKTIRVICTETIEYTQDFTLDELHRLGLETEAVTGRELTLPQAILHEIEEHALFREKIEGALQRHANVLGGHYDVKIRDDDPQPSTLPGPAAELFGPSTPDALAAVREAAQKAADAAAGDSNDEEIDLLRDALEQALALLGLGLPESRDDD